MMTYTKGKNANKTVSTKLPSDLIDEFETVLMFNGHTKTEVFRHALLAYIDSYKDSIEFKNFVDNIQFEDIT